MKTNCLVCSKLVSRGDRNKYCSVDCCLIGRKKPLVNKNCLGCGVLIQRTNFYISRVKTGEFYCSYTCRSIFKVSKRPVHNCAFCKKDYRVKKFKIRYLSEGIVSMLFCSLKCKTSHYSGVNAPTFNPNRELGSRFIRGTGEYIRWRKSVLIRDKNTCQICGISSANGFGMHVDHIKPFCSYPDSRFDMHNGRVLCRECHLKTPTYGKRPHLKGETHEVIARNYR